ncbi:MAG: DNA polymerase III subunit delta' [Pseudolabrys sp.]
MSDGELHILLPRETAALFGHIQAEQALLASYKGGRVPHAWLIGGPPGIGKATLAYRFARFALANPEAAAPGVQSATSLAVDAENPVARRIAAQAQGDLLVLERVVNEQTGKLYTVIRVDDVRRTVSFFGSTAGEGGWRIAARTILLLISHAPGRELPTIRSRCRRLLLRPLGERDLAQALAAATSRAPDDPGVQEAARAADGSVGRAVTLLDETARALRQRVLDLIAQVPEPDPRALHALGDALAGTDPRPLATFMDLVNGWLSAQIAGGAGALPQMARVAETWEQVNKAAREAETYNLERKPLVFAVFGALAQAARP